MNPDAGSFSEYVGFFDRQLDALAATLKYKFLLYGGTRGAGKSYLLRWALVWRLIDWYRMDGLSDVRVMLACESYPTLRDRQISKIAVEFPGWLGELTERKTDGLGFYLRPEWGGGVVTLRNLDEPSKYVGGEYAAIGIDQLEKIPLETFNLLRGSLRWVGIKNTFMLGTGNPGGVGHAWNVAYFIEGNYPPELASMAGQFKFIRAKPSDNAFLPEEYWRDELNTLPEQLRRAWVDGDYYAFVGQGFPAWNNDTHVIKPFIIPAHWPRWRAVDFGTAAPFCCLWFAKDVDSGHVYIYRELYQKNLTDRQQARLIHEYSAGETIAYTYADPAMWSSKSVADIVSSSADEYAAEGVYLIKGDNNRLSGKRKVDRMLMPMPDGKPGLMVFEGCTNLIRTMPNLISDKNNPEDIDTKQEDHAYDALKYGLTNQIAAPDAQRNKINAEAQANQYIRRVSPLTQVKGLF